MDWESSSTMGSRAEQRCPPCNRANALEPLLEIRGTSDVSFARSPFGALCAHSNVTLSLCSNQQYLVPNPKTRFPKLELDHSS
eukprot:1542001-Pyramimonas_sp.AAC.1